jgi:hypothetical protein
METERDRDGLGARDKKQRIGRMERRQQGRKN